LRPCYRDKSKYGNEPKFAHAVEHIRVVAVLTLISWQHIFGREDHRKPEATGRFLTPIRA
jgi:hypothetical protein